ncbi:hypothetical protein GCM10010387_15270 [Streptomyces inusitatus]|uniref:Uncharacterized protein n=1 Tax=Streptomyces inusitatus TaxID=68221 RepID=A0A918PUF2_9ACTN|nr:hypothetical protein GCM10010387_15270 [Streptomyces inusitatus]
MVIPRPRAPQREGREGARQAICRALYRVRAIRCANWRTGYRLVASDPVWKGLDGSVSVAAPQVRALTCGDATGPSGSSPAPGTTIDTQRHPRERTGDHGTLLAGAGPAALRGGPPDPPVAHEGGAGRRVPHTGFTRNRDPRSQSGKILPRH